MQCLIVSPRNNQKACVPRTVSAERPYISFVKGCPSEVTAAQTLKQQCNSKQALRSAFLFLPHIAQIAVLML